jgi:hypothetical protein
VSHALALLLRGKVLEGEAYLVQVLRALHQSALDDGEWESAGLLLPKADPIKKPVFGGTQSELEVIAAYKEALRKLEGKRGSGGGHKGDGDGKKKADKGEWSPAALPAAGALRPFWARAPAT